MSIPDILTIDEMQKLIAAVHLRVRVLIFLDMVTGLRRGELAGFKQADIDFLNLQINVSRSVVGQHAGKCRTEVAQKPVPITLLFWFKCQSADCRNSRRASDSSPPRTISMDPRLLQRADVFNDCLAPTIDVHPLAVTDAVLVAGHVDQVTLASGRGYLVMRLLVGDHDQAVALLVAV